MPRETQPHPQHAADTADATRPDSDSDVAAQTVTVSADAYQQMLARLRDLEHANERAKQAEQQATPAAADGGSAATSATSGDGSYKDDTLVTVLHGYGRVEPTRVEGKLGPSKKVYRAEGGVVRGVLYSDARHWREQWGKQFVHILPNDATEADFARAAGITLMALPKLIAQLEAQNLADLIAAWGSDNALAWVRRFTEALAAESSDTNKRGVRRVPGT